MLPAFALALGAATQAGAQPSALDEKIFDRFDRMVALRDGRIERDGLRAA